MTTLADNYALAAAVQSAQQWRDTALEHIAYAARYKGILNEAIEAVRAHGGYPSVFEDMRDAVENTDRISVIEALDIPAYTNESWEEIADHQLDHDPTPAQLAVRAQIVTSDADMGEIAMRLSHRIGTVFSE